ncbi:MAG: ABC transporter permease [Candidatus Omnitrophica bacterium]|nr:ABC transporter permease [Candidatus Omnitrophota bacterium]
MNYENWISYRYLTARKEGFLAFLHVVSIVGVAIGVAALIVVTGIMTGFGNTLRDRIIGTTPHIKIEKEKGIQEFQKIEKEIASLKGVVGTSAYIQGNIFLEDSGHAVSQVIHGISPRAEDRVTEIKEYLVQGDITDLDGGGIIIGSELARYFGYMLGDEVTLIAPGSGISGHGWRYQLNIVGIFNTGMVDYDMNLSLVSLTKAKEIFALPENTVTGIGVRLADPYAAADIKENIHESLGYSFSVNTWIDINRNLFKALSLEKLGLFIVLSLMVLVASFNIVNTLIVTITSKIHDIGILKSFGVTNSSIRRIFTKQGIFIGLVGTFWGVVGGLVSAYLLATYFKVPQEIYAIDRVPVEIQLSDMLIIVTSALTISFLASIYPAARAARLQPVEALRYE